MRLLALSLVLTGSIAAAASAAEPLVSADWLEGQLGTRTCASSTSGGDVRHGLRAGPCRAPFTPTQGRLATEVAGVPGMTGGEPEALIGGSASTMRATS